MWLFFVLTPNLFLRTFHLPNAANFARPLLYYSRYTWFQKMAFIFGTFLFPPVSPLLEVPVHMIGSPIGKEVTIRCRVESSPRAVTTWRREPGESTSRTRIWRDIFSWRWRFLLMFMWLVAKEYLACLLSVPLSHRNTNLNRMFGFHLSRQEKKNWKLLIDIISVTFSSLGFLIM